jgi:hypothetical protein
MSNTGTYVFDFETVNFEDDCRVWLWGVADVYGEQGNIVVGRDMRSFMRFLSDNDGEYWVHNLGFDGAFIIDWLLKNGFTFTEGKKLKSRQFRALISNQKKFYQIEICWQKMGKTKANKTIIKDSLKKLPFTLARIAEKMGMDIRKGDIDHNIHRPIDWEVTHDELEYLRLDVEILRRAVESFLLEGLTKLTAGADALESAKENCREFDKIFPVLPVSLDDFIRKSYKGGYVYCEPKYKSKELGAGHCIDKNSMYPSQMYFEKLPLFTPTVAYGAPEGEGLWIGEVTLTARVRKGYVPMIQMKGSIGFNPTEYYRFIAEPTKIVVTSVDWDTINRHYHVEVYGWGKVLYFKSQKGMFNQYIDYWMNKKENSTGAERELAKLMLNSLYGKFATRCDVTPKVPELGEDGVVRYVLGSEAEREPIYTALSCFITAYARADLLRVIQLAKAQDRFIYCDTDSVHVLGDELLEGVDYHPTKIGCWDVEKHFEKARYIRAKTYIMAKGDKNFVTCAGWGNKDRNKIPFDDFKVGYTDLHGKRKSTHVPGGVFLSTSPFTIKA